MKSHLHYIAMIATLGTASLGAQTAPAAAPAAPVSFTDALTKGKVSLNARLRYEFVDQDNALDNAEALTLRTRLGYKTVAYQGFQAYIEGQNTTALMDDYQEPGQSPNGHSVVADPETTEVSQAWLGYTNADFATSATVGRQRIVFDNARFIGDVGWRQNYQTFDAVGVTNTSIKKLELNYDYVWNVKRIFDDPAGTGFSDFDSNSHLINASYAGLPFGKLTGYAYLLDLQNDVGFGSSSATYGLSFAGTAPITKELKATYRLEYATQSDYADNPASYDADYYVAEAGLATKKYSAAVGYEVLGSDSGVSFQTPLATLHVFNGWADQFLVTPGTGLTDLYFKVSAALPYDFNFLGFYHKFESDEGGIDYGDEIDLQLSYKVNKNLSLIAKAAFYNADSFSVDTDKFSIQADYAF